MKKAGSEEGSEKGNPQISQMPRSEQSGQHLILKLVVVVRSHARWWVDGCGFGGVAAGEAGEGRYGKLEQAHMQP